MGLSPYEMVYGLPYLGRAADLLTMETKDPFLRNDILAASSTLSSLRLKGLLAQTLPHHFQPGDLVLIKTWKEDKLQPSWEGPYPVLLSIRPYEQLKRGGLESRDW